MLYLAESDNGEYSITIIIPEGTEFDSQFKAYDVDNQEWIVINGWNWNFELITE